jgi:glycosyltransferase involved in cell wall biosynthesis
VATFYRNADVFVLPTLSDGFAITQIEAMAHGLPVIATGNCGQVVRHEVDGLSVPAMNAERLAEAIAWFCDHRNQLEAFSAKALERSREFTLAAYARRLDEQLSGTRA